MNRELNTYREKQAKTILKLYRLASNNFLFRLFLLKILPMGFIAGLKVKKIDPDGCMISVPFKWLNKNPFRSLYFAVLGMAAEMSTGLPAFSLTYKSVPPVSMLVTGMKAEFYKKAADITTFSFVQTKEMQKAVETAVETGEGIMFEAMSTGMNKEGKEVARFYLTWSFRTKIL